MSAPEPRAVEASVTFRRQAGLRATMALLSGFGSLLIGGLFVAFYVMDARSPVQTTSGTLFGVVGGALVICSAAAGCLVPLNLSIRRDPGRASVAGPAALMAVTTVALAVIALVLLAVLWRPEEDTALFLAGALVPMLLLLAITGFTAIGTRHAASRGVQ